MLMETPIQDAARSEEVKDSTFSEGNQRKVASYKYDKSAHKQECNLGGGGEESEEEEWMTIQRREEYANEEPETEEEEENSGDPLCPVYKYDKAAHKLDCKKWENALFVKLLGKKIPFKFLKPRLLKMWNPSGAHHFIEMDNRYPLHDSGTRRIIVMC